jgi:hypothetical protein
MIQGAAEMKPVKFPLALLLAAAFAWPAAAEESTKYQNLLTPLLTAGVPIAHRNTSSVAG